MHAKKSFLANSIEHFQVAQRKLFQERCPWILINFRIGACNHRVLPNWASEEGFQSTWQKRLKKGVVKIGWVTNPWYCHPSRFSSEMSFELCGVIWALQIVLFEESKSPHDALMEVSDEMISDGEHSLCEIHRACLRIGAKTLHKVIRPNHWYTE